MNEEIYNTARETFIRIVKGKAVVRGKVVLSFGKEADWYIDMRRIITTEWDLGLAADLVVHQLHGLSFHAVGGMATGAVPIAIAVMTHPRMNCSSFWVNKETKPHGTQNLVEGTIVPGHPVVVVEDVITTGSSTLKAIQVVRDMGCPVVAVVPLVDRLQGGRELLLDHGILEDVYRPILTIDDLDLGGNERG